jgi:hypothetical protein
MLNWLKDKWEFVAAGLTVVFVFLLGRRGKNASDRKTELKNKENEIIKAAGDKELTAVKAAGEKHAKELKNIHVESEQRLKQAESDRDKLIEQLVNDPDAIDDKLEKIGIKEI